MKDDVRDIREFYDKSVHKEHTRLDRHPIEKDMTWRYLDEYLPGAGSILDIGAATGAYAIPLAQRGYHVTAVDFSSSLLDVCAERAIELKIGDRISRVNADARDLSEIRKKNYDVALIMGPLYHLVHKEDREAAVREAYNHLVPGGIIFSAFISRYGVWGDIMEKNPDSIDSPSGAQLIIDEGQDPYFTEWGRTFRAYFATVPEITPLHERLGFDTLVLAAVEPVGLAADMAYSDMNESQRRKWLNLMYAISREPTILGASCHLLYIGRKL